MKKRDEGYVLPFVLVVMVVLCLVAVSVMSFALSNLKNQQASVQRMQDQYAAQGEIEKVVAQIKSVIDEDRLEELCGENVDLDDEKTLIVKLTVVKKTVQIDCTLKLESDTNIVSDQGGKKLYNLTDAKCTYESYEISTVEGDGTG